MKKRTKRLLIVLLILLTVIVAAAVALVLADVIHNPWQKEIGEAEAARMAADYLEEHHPEMQGEIVTICAEEDHPYWEFATRVDLKVRGDEDGATMARIVVILIDKRTGELRAGVSD